jgi:hypothetical protein
LCWRRGGLPRLLSRWRQACVPVLGNTMPGLRVSAQPVPEHTGPGHTGAARAAAMGSGPGRDVALPGADAGGSAARGRMRMTRQRMGEGGTQAKRGSRRTAGDPQRQLADAVKLAVPARGGAMVWVTHTTPWLSSPAGRPPVPSFRSAPSVVGGDPRGLLVPATWLALGKRPGQVAGRREAVWPQPLADGHSVTLEIQHAERVARDRFRKRSEPVNAGRFVVHGLLVAVSRRSGDVSPARAAIRRSRGQLDRHGKAAATGVRERRRPPVRGHQAVDDGQAKAGPLG